MPLLVLIWRAMKGGLLLATDAAGIIEVLPPVACRPTPGAPDWVRGLFVHRGELVPLVDVHRLLHGLTRAAGSAPSVEQQACEDRLCNRVLAVRLPPAGDGVERRIGLWVQSILELERVDFTGAGTHPGLSTEGALFLGPVASTRRGLVQLVSAQEMFSREQIDLLTNGSCGVVA